LEMEGLKYGTQSRKKSHAESQSRRGRTMEGLKNGTQRRRVKKKSRKDAMAQRVDNSGFEICHAESQSRRELTI
jgi:hypothetical protein